LFGTISAGTHSPLSKHYFVGFAILFRISSLVSVELVHLSHFDISSGNSLNDECISLLVSLKKWFIP
jgi:hypothetical protein